jgi:hypothetical protein
MCQAALDMQSSKAIVRRAMELQEERRRANSRSLPLWVIPAILFFGWNEMASLLRSPVLLVVCILALLFLYQLYTDLDVDREMEKGLPAAAITIGRRIWPTSKQIVINTGEAIKQFMFTGVSNNSDQVAASSSSPLTTPARKPAWSVAGSELEMSPLMGSPVEGLRRRAADDEQRSPALGGGLEIAKDL